jgi:hypothetical protein
MSVYKAFSSATYLSEHHLGIPAYASTAVQSHHLPLAWLRHREREEVRL